MYKVYLERAAERDLKQLSSQLFGRIIAKVKALADNPRPPGGRKISGSKNDWRIRIGNYRVIYEVDDAHSTVNIMKVRHRREVYR